MGRTCQDQMSCDTVSLLLPLYFDGILRRKEHEEVRAHLSQCLTCRRLTLVEQNPLQGLPRIPPELMAQFATEFDASLAEALEDPALKQKSASGRLAWRARKRSPQRPLAPRFWDQHRTSLTWFSGLIVGATTSWAAAMWWKGPSSTTGLEALRAAGVPQQPVMQPTVKTQPSTPQAVAHPVESSAMTVQMSPANRRRHSDTLPLAPQGQSDRAHLQDVVGDLSPHRLDVALPWMGSGTSPLSTGTDLIPSSALSAEHFLYSRFSSGQLY